MDDKPVRLIGRKPELKAKFVCKICNGGWMCNLEGANRPLLGALLKDFFLPIDPLQQWGAAQWAVKTAMVMERVGSPKEVFYTKTERKLLASATLPQNTNVWLARYSGNNDLAFTGMHLWDRKPEGSEVIHCYLNTLVVGYLAIQVISVHVPAGYSPFQLKVRPGPWERLLIPIWPAGSSIVRWPPPLTIDDRTIGLGDLVERFKGEESVAL